MWQENHPRVTPASPIVFRFVPCELQQSLDRQFQNQADAQLPHPKPTFKCFLVFLPGQRHLPRQCWVYKVPKEVGTELHHNRSKAILATHLIPRVTSGPRRSSGSLKETRETLFIPRP